MAENIENTLPQITEPNIQGVLTHLCSTNNKLRVQIPHRDDKIVILENEITELKTRMSDQKQYPSKDCLIFSKFPVNPLSNTLPMDMSIVIQETFRYQVGPDCMKVCHPMKITGENIPIIIKFVYFNDKNEIFRRRKQLSGQLNNGTQMYINERLSKADTEIIEESVQLALLSISKNCVVKVFRKKKQN